MCHSCAELLEQSMITSLTSPQFLWELIITHYVLRPPPQYTHTSSKANSWCCLSCCEQTPPWHRIEPAACSARNISCLSLMSTMQRTLSSLHKHVTVSHSRIKMLVATSPKPVSSNQQSELLKFQIYVPESRPLGWDAFVHRSSCSLHAHRSFNSEITCSVSAEPHSLVD